MLTSLEESKEEQGPTHMDTSDNAAHEPTKDFIEIQDALDFDDQVKDDDILTDEDLKKIAE